MRIAVSAAAPDLDAEVEPRFGRCQYFVIVDPQSMEFEGLENSGAMAAGGAGISTAQMIADKGVEVVLTGNCGPNAYRTLSAAGVQVVTGVSGRIRDAVEAYRAGKLKPNAQPSVESHYGMGMGSGTAGGMGRGMGAGMTPPAASQPMSPEQEMEALKSQTRMMMEQLGQIQSRITELEKKS
jgi:predicted Fe-Mo cluster-binding NifX family protein